MSVRNPEGDYLKLVVIGDSGVGKTSLVRRYQTVTSGDLVYLSTTGINISTLEIELDGETITAMIWDAERPISSRISNTEEGALSAYHNEAHGIIIVYDCTDQESFTNVRQWLEEIERYAPENVNKLLVGSKCDLESKKVIDASMARELANELDIPFLETSAKNSTNVEMAFQTMLGQIPEAIRELY
ncbi:unnamed protein product, partial [Cyprideis torosa]